MLPSGQARCPEDLRRQLKQGLGTVLLEEWGGPRSPLALQFLHETVIPDLLECLCANDDLWCNPTFREIMAWKLKTQFGYPAVTADPLASDLLLAAAKASLAAQVTDPKIPWQRIFRLWVSGEPLPNIAERTRYPLEYLDLLLFRFKRLSKFMGGREISLAGCLQEFPEFGLEQLSFLYQLHVFLATDSLYPEKMALENVIYELNLPIKMADLLSLLEVIHANEGQLDKDSLMKALRDEGVDYAFLAVLPQVMDGLMRIHWLQKGRSGKLNLSEKSAHTISAFLLPKITEQVFDILVEGHLAEVGDLIATQNEEMVIALIDRLVNAYSTFDIVQVLGSLLNRLNRRVDIHIIKALGKVNGSYEILVRYSADKDSLIRGAVCQALGEQGAIEGIKILSGMLKDKVPEVRAQAALALGRMHVQEAVPELQRLAGDLSESVLVRESALQALWQMEVNM